MSLLAVIFEAHFLCGLDALLVKLDELQMESLLDAVKALEAKGLRKSEARERRRKWRTQHMFMLVRVRRRRRKSFRRLQRRSRGRGWSTLYRLLRELKAMAFQNCCRRHPSPKLGINFPPYRRGTTKMQAYCYFLVKNPFQCAS